MRPTRLAAGLAAGALLLAACSGGDGDVDAALQNLMAVGMTEQQAQCVVEAFGEDRLDEVDNFDEDFAPDADIQAELTEEISQICKLGSPLPSDAPTGEPSAEAPTATASPPSDPEPSDGSPSASPTASPGTDGLGADWDCSQVEGPCVYGDDPQLDVLWDDCDEGSGAACDQLSFQSQTGSAYEDFGNTCGGRGVETSCEAVYGGGEDAGQDQPEVTTSEIDCSDVDGPCDYGDDADLDALWDGCEAGDADACDELAIEAPSGSRYEQFGYYCGDRTEELADCAAVM